MQQQNLNQIDVSLILVCFIFLWNTFLQSRFAKKMQFLDICQVLVNFLISFLFGKQFWASLHLLSESGWNWCPWQALVSFRFPIPMHCIFMSLSFLCKVGGFFQSRVVLISWTEGSFSHSTLGNWAEHCFLKFQSCIWSSCHELLKSYINIWGFMGSW